MKLSDSSYILNFGIDKGLEKGQFPVDWNRHPKVGPFEG